MGTRHVTVFDFDGTLTTKDTLFEFIRFAKGTWSLCWGVLCCLPVLLACLLHLCPNGKAKQRFFSHFFQGMSYQQFCQLGSDFAAHIDTFQRQSVLSELEDCIAANHDVYVITASIEEWVRPWCERHGVTHVLGTQVEQEGGLLTGRFSSPNCYGQEKVRRLLAAEPARDSYVLCVFGDSRGDEPLLAMADKAIRI